MTGENESPTEIHKSATIERVYLKSTHEEVDNILVHQLVVVAQENQEGISVMSDDTDVCLLCYHYQDQNLSLPVVMEFTINDRAVMDKRQTVQRNCDIVPDLIDAYALFGCNMVVGFHGIGKGTALKTLHSGYHFHAVEDTDAELPVVIQEATTFVSACFGYPESKNRVGKLSKSVSNLSFTENVKGAHLDACFEW